MKTRYIGNIKKKGDISMETIVVVVIALAVLLVIIGIFTFQARKGSGKLNEVGDSANSQSEQTMCIGDNAAKDGKATVKYSCYTDCTKAIIGDKFKSETPIAKSCLMPDMKCCELNP